MTRSTMRSTIRNTDRYAWLMYVCCINLEPMRIGGVKSEVRILGTESRQGVVLLTPMEAVENGDRFFEARAVLSIPNAAWFDFYCYTLAFSRLCLAMKFCAVLQRNWQDCHQMQYAVMSRDWDRQCPCRHMQALRMSLSEGLLLVMFFRWASGFSVNRAPKRFHKILPYPASKNG